jgi:hypothetical protein
MSISGMYVKKLVKYVQEKKAVMASKYEIIPQQRCFEGLWTKYDRG